jgi:nucleotide-binding universal stress UspA family protein
MTEVSAKLWRILLPLDVSRDSLTALQAAFDLAATLGGEISGLFIEDARLLAAGSLPFAREVGSLSGNIQAIGSSDIERAFQALANRARYVIGQAGHRLNVRFSFRVTRGDVAAEILTATADADMVVLGKAGWSIGKFRKPGRTCLAILSASRIPVLIIEQGATLAAPILAVNDGTTSGRRAVDFAHELSRSLGWGIGVFSVHGMSTGDEVLKSIRHEKPRLIVLPSSLPLTECFSNLKCAVVVVP